MSTATMDVKQIEQHGRDLQKAASQPSSDTSTILKMLRELRAGVRATPELLRSTKIGIAVNRLKQHKDATVQREATDLVNTWRTHVSKGGSNGGPPTPTTPSASKPKESGAKVKPSERNAAKDGVEVKTGTGDSTRDNCAKLMYDGLAFMREEPSSQIVPLALSIEKAAWDRNPPPSDSVLATSSYKAQVRSLYQNLRSTNSRHLSSGILSTPPTITPTQLVTMTPDELKSEQQRAEDERIRKDNMDKAMVAQADKSISGSLKCGGCGAKKVSYTQAQTRSADEPMTTFCECMSCGRKWKFS